MSLLQRLCLVFGPLFAAVMLVVTLCHQVLVAGELRTAADQLARTHAVVLEAHRIALELPPGALPQTQAAERLVARAHVVAVVEGGFSAQGADPSTWSSAGPLPQGVSFTHDPSSLASTPTPSSEDDLCVLSRTRVVREAGSEERGHTLAQVAISPCDEAPERWTGVVVEDPAHDLVHTIVGPRRALPAAIAGLVGLLIALALALPLQRQLQLLVGSMAAFVATGTLRRPRVVLPIDELHTLADALSTVSAVVADERARQAQDLAQSQRYRDDLDLARALRGRDAAPQVHLGASMRGLGGTVGTRPDGSFHLLHAAEDRLVGVVGRMRPAEQALERELDARAVAATIGALARRGALDSASLRRLARRFGLADLQLGALEADGAWTWSPLEEPEPTSTQADRLSLGSVSGVGLHLETVLDLWCRASVASPQARLDGIRASLAPEASGSVVLLVRTGTETP